MEEHCLDLLLVPLGLLGAYHLWLLYSVLCYPSQTVFGLNVQSRCRWVLSMMTSRVLGVQTMRNNVMASTLATRAIALSSLIGIFASSDTASKLVCGNKASLNSSVKRLSISIHTTTQITRDLYSKSFKERETRLMESA